MPAFFVAFLAAGGGEHLGAEYHVRAINHGGDVKLFMRIDATNNDGRNGIYSQLRNYGRL